MQQRDESPGHQGHVPSLSISVTRPELGGVEPGCSYLCWKSVTDFWEVVRQYDTL